MKNLPSLLERLTGALHADAVLKASVCAAIEECTGGTVSEGKVSVKNGILTIEASPALKNELRLKEARVLDCVYQKSGKRIVRVIYG